ARRGGLARPRRGRVAARGAGGPWSVRLDAPCRSAAGGTAQCERRLCAAVRTEPRTLGCRRNRRGRAAVGAGEQSWPDWAVSARGGGAVGACRAAEQRPNRLACHYRTL